MNEPVQSESQTAVIATVSTSTSNGNRLRLTWFGLFVAILAGLFHQPLMALGQYALKEELYSHIFLIPVVSVYFWWLRRHEMQAPLATSWVGSVVTGCLGGAILLVYTLARRQGYEPSHNDHLSIIVFALLVSLLAVALLCFGGKRLRQHFFPIAFLIFVVPMPGLVTRGISHFLQHGSAEVSYAMLQLTGTPVFRQGLVFQLPGITIEVAEECSGIRSTLVLFITSLLAGQLFLRSDWKRATLAAIVLPIAILRNALRIITISMLCVHVDPGMINSVVHRHGGPFFFIVSLVPFFLILWWLRKSETKLNHANAPKGPT